MTNSVIVILFKFELWGVHPDDDQAGFLVFLVPCSQIWKRAERIHTVYVQKSMSATCPRRESGVSGFELNHSVAPPLIDLSLSWNMHTSRQK